MSVTSKGRRWENLHSLWIGWTFTPGFFNWVAFLYIGLRVGRIRWILYGLFYTIPFVLAMIWANTPAFGGWIGDLTVALTVIQGIISIVHAFRIRNEYLLRLENAPRHNARKAEALRQDIDGQSEAVREEPTTSPEKTPRETAYSDADNRTREQPAGTPDRSPVHTPPVVRPSPGSSERLTKRAEDAPAEPASIPANYPLPLAYSYRLVEAEFETLRILKEVYRNAEGLTAFLASLTLALIPAPTGDVRKYLLRAWGGKGATFGNWFSILVKASPLLDEEKGPLYRSTKQLLGTGGNSSSFAANMRWLMDQRDDLHHGDLPVGGEADELVREARQRFERCVSEAAPIWRHPPRLVLDYDAVRNSDHVVATCLDYTGDHPAGRKVREEYRGIPKKQDLYIVQEGEDWITLYPFVSVQYCHHCHARETYFVDGWAGPGEEADLRSFERSHEERSSEIGEELTRLLGR